MLELRVKKFTSRQDYSYQNLEIEENDLDLSTNEVDHILEVLENCVPNFQKLIKDRYDLLNREEIDYTNYQDDEINSRL